MKLAILVGDRREVEAAGYFRGWVEEVVIAGCPVNLVPEGIGYTRGLPEALAGARLVVGPVLGLDSSGGIKNAYGCEMKLEETALASMQKGGLLFFGSSNPALEVAAAAAGVRVIPYRERDDFAILNSIPSAEGALQVAMENLPVTLHGSTALVLGLGRTGLTLARMLCGLGARTVVVARNPAQLARAAEMGCCPVPLRNLGAVIREGTVVFNTIPALVLNREVLGKAQPELLIIDLASAPGGTDFAGAGELGLKTIWALGLPGKVAPRTAGRAIFQVVASFLAREFPEEFADVLGDF